MTTQIKQIDEQFVTFMLEVDMRYKQMAKSDQVKIEKWVTFKDVSYTFVVQSTMQQPEHNLGVEKEQESLCDVASRPNYNRET